MNILIGLILLIILIIYIGLYFLYKIVATKIKILLGYKKYEYTKILSHGMRDEYMWHKTDNLALKYYTHFEFISEIKPNKRRLRPLK